MNGSQLLVVYKPHTMLERMVAVIRLVRVSNSLPAAILVLIGARLAGIWPIPGAAWQAAGAMWFVTAFGYASNDYFDLAEDALNKPDRPLPSGVLSSGFAAGLALVLAIGAIVLSLPLGIAGLLASVTALFLLTIYNTRLKGTPGGGNVLVAVLAGCTLFVGSFAVLGPNRHALEALLLPALILICFIATREILKTVEDVAGDAAVSKRTVATSWGVTAALHIISVLTATTILVSLLPVFWLHYSITYLILMMVGIHAPLVFTTVYLARDASQPRVSRCLSLLKGSYFAGILALLLA